MKENFISAKMILVVKESGYKTNEFVTSNVTHSSPKNPSFHIPMHNFALGFWFQENIKH